MTNPYRTAAIKKPSARPTISGRLLVIAFLSVGVLFITVMIELCAR